MEHKKLEKKKIVFIASYMKSGNTWVRSIICSLLNNGNFKLDDLKEIKLFSQETFFLKLKKLKYQKDGNLDFSFVSRNWINAQKLINKTEAKDVKFFKTHNIRGIINNNYFTDESVCKGFIYLIRDPRDIVVSLAKHMNVSHDTAIDIMLFQKNFVTNVFKVNEAVCTWKMHTESWINFKTVPRLIIRYEDMVKNNENAIIQISNYIKILYDNKIFFDKSIIADTLEKTNFNNLQKLEQKNGFVEATSDKFFRKGISGQWQNILSNNQINLIQNELKDYMNALGYN